MLDITHGIGMFFIGCTVTFIGFFIAYMVASNVAVSKEPKELSEVEKSLKNLRYGTYGDDCQ
tara:strand:- start:375 stop:560 length:186 start_codon:yes stop_codon:yes gene_type:complete